MFFYRASVVRTHDGMVLFLIDIDSLFVRRLVYADIVLDALHHGNYFDGGW